MVHWNRTETQVDEMYKTFKLVLEDRQDPNRERRIAEARKAGILGSNASQAIVDYLTKLLAPDKVKQSK